MGEATCHRNLCRRKGRESDNKILVGRRIAHGILSKRVYQAEHDDHEEAFKFPAQENAEEQTQSTIAESSAKETKPDHG